MIATAGMPVAQGQLTVGPFTLSQTRRLLPARAILTRPQVLIVVTL